MPSSSLVYGGGNCLPIVLSLWGPASFPWDSASWSNANPHMGACLYHRPWQIGRPDDLSGCTCSDIAVCSYEPSFPSAQAPDLSLEAEGHVPFAMTKLASSGSNMV